MHPHKLSLRFFPFLGLVLFAVMALHSAALADCTNLWFTRNGCGTSGETHFHAGDVIYFNGTDFLAGPTEYTIYGLPGSCDEYVTVLRETFAVDTTGTFCFAAYTVEEGDCGQYAVQMGECYNIFTVDRTSLQIMDLTLDSNWEETIGWTIDKIAQPAQLDLFQGDQAEVRYTISVDKTVVTSPAVISGAVTIENNGVPAGFSLTVTLKKDGTPLDQTVITTVSPAGLYPFSFTLAAPVNGTYAVDAVVTITNGTGDSESGTVSLTRETTGFPAIHVTDGPHSWPFAEDGSTSYTTLFSCDADEGQKINVATIIETGQNAAANVTINCYAPEVSKTADPAFTRTYLWSIRKSGNKQEEEVHFLLPVDPDAPLPVTTVQYTVVADTTGYVDSNWQVSGTITVSNPAPIPAVIQNVTDLISGFGAPAVNFAVTFPYTLAPGGTLTGTYSTSLPDAAPRTNTATALLVNHYYALAAAPAAIGTTSFSGSAAITFGTPSLQIDACAAVSDNLAGTLGNVCLADLPQTFVYSRQFGPWNPQECGATFERTNVATLLTSDTGTSLTSQWQVTIRIACDEQRQPLGVSADCIDPFVYKPTIRVHFIVTNPNSFAVEIPHGLNNALEPAAYQGSQPTLFGPGTTEWEVEIGRYEILQWLLDGAMATASLKTTICTYATQDDVYIAGVGVFYDTNKNGMYDVGEALLAPDFEGKIGEVYLLDAAGQQIDSRTLGASLFYRAGEEVNFSMRQVWGEFYLVPQLSVPLPTGYRLYPNYRLIHTDEFPAPFYSLNNDFGLVPAGFVADPAVNQDLPWVAALDTYLSHPVKPGVSKSVSEPVAAIGLATAPSAFGLQQNYPNPFNPQTTISYDLSESCSVTLTVYTVTGTEVARLVDSEQAGGHYTRIWDASGNPSGIYFYELRAGSFRQIKRMLLMK